MGAQGSVIAVEFEEFVPGIAIISWKETFRKI